MTRLQRFFMLALALCAAAPAWPQAPGHLGVPGLQQVHSGFAPVPGLPAQNHYLINVMHPDGTADTMSSAYLVKQTLVYTDFVLLIWRNAGSVLATPESGEIYLGDYDSSQKGRPLQDQMPLVRYTIPAHETRAVLRVSLTAGRAYSGYRQPLLVHYSNTVDLNARALGYVLPN